MSLFRLNIVFHKFLVTECYEELSQEDIEQHIRFVAVNGKVQKQIPNQYKRFTIYESSLPWYNPFMQHNRFCESSAFFHAWRNPQVFLEQPYIGFFHYDMVLKKEAIDFLTEQTTAAEAAGKKVVFAPYCHEARQHLCQIINLEEWEQIVRIYNQIFGTHHDIHTVIDTDIPLYHTFVLHKELFHRMMCFAEIVAPRLFDMLGFDTRHLPFMLERVHGVFLALQRQDGATGEWLPLPGVIHEDRLKDAWQKTGAS
jgi:hypothetical protein